MCVCIANGDGHGWGAYLTRRWLCSLRGTMLSMQWCASMLPPVAGHPNKTISVLTKTLPTVKSTHSTSAAYLHHGFPSLCDIGCTRGSVARDDASTDKCNFRYCLLGPPGAPKKVPKLPLWIARAMILGEQNLRMWIRPLVLHGCCAFWLSTGFVLFGRNAEWWIHFCRVASLLSLLSRSIFGRNR